MDTTTRLDERQLTAALSEGDIRVLLMVLVHLTGDLRWLESPYLPKRDIRLVPEPGARLDASVQTEIRDAVKVALLDGGAPQVTDPGNELMGRMMSICLGERVPAEYAPLNREEMGLVPRNVEWSRRVEPGELVERQVLIVGAGVCGLALGMRLKELGIPFLIVDRNRDVGGTWYVNRYPGCGVDTPNHSYSYSFGKRFPWSRYFSRREEVQAYLAGVADEFDLRQHIRFETDFLGSRWDESEQRWSSSLRSGTTTETFSSGYLVSAIGQLSDPAMPTIVGAERFEGRRFHSSNWSDDIAVEGKRIAVIGTGATAMQFVPAIADQAAEITIYQRTPQWSRPIPGYADAIGEGTQWLLEHVPYYAEWFRFNMFWRYGDGLLQYLRKDPAWPHADRSVNRINDRHRQEMEDFIRSELTGRDDLIKQCIPSYPPYGKRILLDNGWYRTLRKPNVKLVDTPIGQISENAVETVDGVSRHADIIVYSTGFKVYELAGRLGIVGRDGMALADAWADENPSAFLGLSVPGFPNFFTMLGPGSGPAHGGSVVFQAECQARYITACIVQMTEDGTGVIDVRRDVHNEHLQTFDAEHANLIWSHPGMSTYYRNRHGRVFSAMPWRFVDYWAMTHDPLLTHYETLPKLTAARPTRHAQDVAGIK